MRRRGTRPPVDPLDESAAWEAALRRLGHQPLATAVLGQRLQDLGYARQTVAAVLRRAAAAGYLDDRAYAESLVRRRSRTRGRSLIAQELRAKGVADAEVAEALGRLDGEEEESRALALARSQLRQHPPRSVLELRRRVGSALDRRGFRPSTIVRVASRLRGEWDLAARDADPDADLDE